MRNFDEMTQYGASARMHYEPYSRWLHQQPRETMQTKRDEAELIFRRVGITFALHGDEAGTERLIPFDLIPRIIPAAERSDLEAGLAQRVKASPCKAELPQRTLPRASGPAYAFAVEAPVCVKRCQSWIKRPLSMRALQIRCRLDVLVRPVWATAPDSFSGI